MSKPSDSFSSHIDPDEWRSGMMVEWRAIDATGQIVHVPEDQNILMVDVMEREGGEWQSTGYTLTAGYQDVVPMRQSTRPQMSTDFETENDVYGINVTFAAPAESSLADGFNRHGVRENEDGSIDVRFNAMEPGKRKGYQITSSFLRDTASKSYDRLPLQLDHSDSQRANVGYIDPEYVKFDDGFLRLQAHIPNTGSTIRDDVIADFTHEPPAIKDISIGFDPKSVEVEAPASDEAPRFTDARIKEVSLTPFPAGYDNGGLTPAFSEALDSALPDENGGDADADDATSMLVTKRYKIN